uniref:ATP synthase F0 subunit 8 n=1 Tax=Atkinsoniella nigrita TaxID=2937673 RepID=UPI00208E0C39|nr:ATP synthase F0 subunit 8 [Atkinsoniella nigrita]USC52164.1 ATP synthase F0 subunit 8 [Atkinsoniella nigrita]
MPQMAPIFWMTLMITFILMMLMMMTIMYFNMMNKSMKKNDIFTNQMNWKW